MKENNRRDSGAPGLAIGMCIGIAIGTAIGAETHNIGLWLPIGLSIGTCLGLTLGRKSEGNGKDDGDDKK